MTQPGYVSVPARSETYNLRSSTVEVTDADLRRFNIIPRVIDGSRCITVDKGSEDWISLLVGDFDLSVSPKHPLGMIYGDYWNGCAVLSIDPNNMREVARLGFGIWKPANPREGDLHLAALKRGWDALRRRSLVRN